MSVIHITESAEFQKVISSGVTLVDFSASWCGPCKRVEPVFKVLAKENPTVKFVHVDVDEASDSMSKELENVSGVPHFELFHNGSRISQFSGANLNKIRESVQLLKSKLEIPTEEQPNEQTKTEQVAKQEPAQKEEAKLEPAQKSQAKQEPAQKEEAKQEPAQKEEAKLEPAQKEEAKLEPAQKSQAKQEPTQEDTSKEEPENEENNNESVVEEKNEVETSSEQKSQD